MMNPLPLLEDSFHTTADMTKVFESRRVRDGDGVSFWNTVASIVKFAESMTDGEVGDADSENGYFNSKVKFPGLPDGSQELVS